MAVLMCLSVRASMDGGIQCVSCAVFWVVFVPQVFGPTCYQVVSKSTTHPAPLLFPKLWHPLARKNPSAAASLGEWAIGPGLSGEELLLEL